MFSRFQILPVHLKVLESKKSSRDCGGQETTPYCVVWVFVYREKVDKKFIDACLYVKDRMEEVSSPDKEMVSGFFWL